MAAYGGGRVGSEVGGLRQRIRSRGAEGLSAKPQNGACYQHILSTYGIRVHFRLPVAAMSRGYGLSLRAGGGSTRHFTFC